MKVLRIALPLPATGGLDPSFGTGRIVTANLPAGGEADALLVQPDGKIVLVGDGFISGGGVTLVLARLTP